MRGCGWREEDNPVCPQTVYLWFSSHWEVLMKQAGLAGLRSRTCIYLCLLTHISGWRLWLLWTGLHPSCLHKPFTVCTISPDTIFFLDRDVDFGDSKLHRVISNARFRAEAGDSEITHNGSLAPLLISAPNDLWQNLFIKTRSQFPGFQVIESSRHTPREVRLGSSEQRRGCVT